MFPGMTVLLWLSALWLRGIRVLTSARGAFDLTSVVTGAVVVAILVGGTFAATFGVIPFAQDHGARQELLSARTAEGVAKAKDGKFLAGAGLESSGYLSSGPSLAVGADAQGSCWVGITRSGSGAAFYATSANAQPADYLDGTDTGCLTADQQLDLAISAGAAKPAMAAGWGAGFHGQLANGSTANQTLPVFASMGVMEGKSLTAITAGERHTCGLAGGAAYCWGNNASGQLGIGTTTDSNVPVAVSTSGALAGKTVTAVSAGDYFTCAIADGAAYCWGNNAAGQLGNGTTASSSFPVAVDMSGVLAGRVITSLDTGGTHVCAVASAEAFCWGGGAFGQLGNGTTTASQSVPVAVHKQMYYLMGKTVLSIAAGRIHTCVTVDTATVQRYCWGSNQNRQQGHTTNSQSTIPSGVSDGILAGKKIIKLTSGPKSDHTCAVADGAAYCWGANVSGQIGNNTTGTWTLTEAVDTSGALSGKTVTEIAVAKDSTCAVADRSAYCWGGNTVGQLGNGSQTGSPVPVAVGGELASKKVMALDGGSQHIAAAYR